MPESNVGMEETQNEDILVHGNLLLVYANTNHGRPDTAAQRRHELCM